jgi:hypothetical protein
VDFEDVSAVPESVLETASGFEASVLDDSELAAAVSVFDDSSLSAPARLRLFSLSPLKSVSYQPPPFRRKFGAETSFFRAFLPHDGHFVRGASVIFCITSE